MKAVTLRPPWGWAVLNGKDVENRSRNIAGSYRGPLVIHQGKRPIPADDPDRDLILNLTGRLPLVEHPGTLGAALGVVELVDVHLCHRSNTFGHRGQPVCFDDHTPIGLLCSPWAQYDDVGGIHHLVLRNPCWFPEPIPYRGQLGLWEFPDELLPEEFR